jgi:hypothetical protein
MVIPFLTQPPHERTLTGWGSRVYPNVRAAGCTLTSGQPGAAWSGQEVCSGFALAARASPLAARCMNSYYTIRIKKCMNWYKNHTVYEFVLHNLYNNCIKISEKKIWIRVGISTWDQNGLQSSQRHVIHHPTSSISAHFIYHIRTPSEKVDYDFIRMA